MLFRRSIAALAALVLSATVALAQGASFSAGTVWGNDTASARPGKVSTVTSILDRALGSTRGAIIERGASGWAIVVPSATVGLAWVSAGTGADPVYGVVSLAGGGCNAALTASNGGILYSTASACSILAGIANAGRPLLSGSSAAPTWAAFSLPASVTSGGVAFFDSTSSMASSAALAASRIVFGGGAGVAPATGLALGTTTQVLHGNAAGLPTWAAVSLTADVSGQLPIANGGCNGTTTTTCFNNVAPTPTRAGDLIYYNGANWISLAGNNSGTKFLQEDASGVPSWVAAPGSGTVTTLTAGAGISFSSGATCTTTCTVSQSLTNATLEGAPANPTLTASATDVMMGLGVTTCRITPVYASRLQVNIQGNAQTATTGQTGTIQVRAGTGAGIANGSGVGASVTIGSKLSIAVAAAGIVPFRIGGIITGLTPGATVYLDIAASITSGNFTLTSISCSASEF